MIKIYTILVILGLLSAIGLGAYVFYTDTQKTITDLTSSLAMSEVKIAELEQTLASIEEDKETQIIANRALSRKLNTAERFKEDIIKVLSDHNLTKLASAKPGLIQSRINDGTKKALEDLTLVTTNSSTDDKL